MSGGIEDWHAEMNEEDDVIPNVVHATFNKQELSKQKLLDTVRDMNFDNIVLVGTKGQDIYAVHTGLSDVVELIGLLEIVKLNCMMEKVG